MPTVEILSQGDEVVTGQTVDTNAAWLSDRLTALGLTVVRHTAVGDRMGDIQDVVAAARTRVDVVVSTGGLGPTEDDLTTAAVASVYGVEPVFDPVAMAHIEALYARYGRPMPEVNRKQAVLPDGCIRLDNHWGTAPAFAMEDAHCVAFFLPGVPREMRSACASECSRIHSEAASPRSRRGTISSTRPSGISVALKVPPEQVAVIA